jgi:hypothetical protein
MIDYCLVFIHVISLCTPLTVISFFFSDVLSDARLPLTGSESSYILNSWCYCNGIKHL